MRTENFLFVICHIKDDWIVGSQCTYFKFSVLQLEDFSRALKYFMENLRAMNFLRKMLCGVKVCKFSITCWLFPFRFQIKRGEIFDFTRLFHYLLIPKIQDPSRQNVSKFLKSFKNEIVQKPFCSTSLESWDRIWQLMSWSTPNKYRSYERGSLWPFWSSDTSKSLVSVGLPP